MRINKYLSQEGISSRREADRAVESGLIFINGKKAELGQSLELGDEIAISSWIASATPRNDAKTSPRNDAETSPRNDTSSQGAQRQSDPEKQITLIYTGEAKEKIYLAYYKAKGLVCTCSKDEPDNIIDAINYKERIYPIGRLDKDSKGLILLTNDGELCFKLSHPSFEHEKEYVVVTKEKLIKSDLQKLSQGIKLEEKTTSPCVVEQIGAYKFRMILKEGLNRQIRRMCKEVGYTVKDLIRTRIANIALENELASKDNNVSYLPVKEGNYVKIDSGLINKLLK